jgi:hypothetical protein
VIQLARQRGVPVALIVGDSEEDLDLEVPICSLTQQYGHERAMTQTAELIEACAGRLLED